MKNLLSRTRCLPRAWLWALLCVLGLALAGCGGGGASANNTAGGGGSGGGSGGGGSGGGTSNVSTGVATLQGVVAVGSPVLGATVSVVDALGVDQGSAVTAITDGAYQFTLSTTSRTLPLFIQARGIDTNGAPVVVHTVVQSLTTGASTTNHVHINPFTDAVVALLLGGDPRPYFQTPTGYASWTLLGNALALEAANTFLKTVIRANLTDARLADLAAVNFFSDPSFAADKTRLDAVLESIRIQYGTASNGHRLIKISNRLALAGMAEVVLDLDMTLADLAALIPTINADVVLSTLRETTAGAAVMPYVAGLNTLSATINLGMAQRLPPLELANYPIFSYSYTHFDGQTGLDTVTKLSNWGTSGYQLSNFQMLGCLDDPVGASGCNQMAVSALVRDGSGNVVDVFNEVVTYTLLDGWRLRGNDRQTPWYVHPTTWAEWDGTGALAAGVTPNPGQGMLVRISAREFMLATVQTPNGHALPFYHCDATVWSLLCLGVTETGDLIDDHVLRSTRTDWVGGIDAVPGAIYRIQTVTLGAGSENNTNRVQADLPPTTDLSQYPLPDGISAGTPITALDVIANSLDPTTPAGMTVSWADWAADNPHLSMIEVRAVIRSAATAPVKVSARVMPLSGTQITLPAFASVPSDALTFHLWLIARDADGRRYISKINALP